MRTALKTGLSRAKSCALLLAITSASLTANAQTEERIYAPKETVVDTFFQSYIVPDDYRWMENTSNEALAGWLKEEHKASRKYINKARLKTNAYPQIERYSSAHFDNPYKMGKYYFYRAYSSYLKASCLFIQDRVDGPSEVLIDPTYISTKDEVKLHDFELSADSKYIAYTFGRNGSDWRELMVMNVDDHVNLKDHLTNLKFSNIAWRGNGFYYQTTEQEGEFGKIATEQIYYHVLGTEQSEDQLVFKRNASDYSLHFMTTSNERYLVISEQSDRLGYASAYYIDFNSPMPAIRPFISKSATGFTILDSHGDELIFTTLSDDDVRTVYAINPAQPKAIRQLVPEFQDSYLRQVIPLENDLVATYSSNQVPMLTVFDYQGNLKYKLELPAGTSLRNLSAEYYDSELLFTMNGYTFPPIPYTFNLKTYRKELLKATEISYTYDEFVTEQIEYPAADGTLIPMLLVHQKDMKLDGQNPVILKAYGGFGITSVPSFDPGIVYFVKKGGVFAFAGIRGGGDKGPEWAAAGRGRHKQTSFDDFADAARFLIKENYTRPDKLASIGGSNGGLVVAATAMQHPELFKAVVPEAAPMDMLRFENFTIGVFHTNEYGTVADSASFVRMSNYSPYHLIQDDVNYPSMFIRTGDNDDRVPPFHSYKFTAAMQARDAQQNPIILQVNEDEGHSGSNNYNDLLERDADIYSFIMNELDAN